MVMLNEAATSVGPACRAGLPTKVAQPINSSNQTPGTDHTPSLLLRSSGEKVADRADEGVTADYQPPKNSRFSSTLKAVSVLTVLFGIWLGFAGRSIDPVTPSAIAEAAAAPTSTPKYKTVAIREIQPAGYKVLADNPQTPGQAAGDFGQFDPKTWHVHRFMMNKPDGGWLRIGLARPMAWIDAVERNNSGKVWLEFEELGIGDWATLQATEPCPDTIIGEGRLVTGTFEHSSGEVLNLYIAGEATPIGSTSNHPFWSEDRQDFVQAGSLESGEHLRLADGRTTTLERAEPIAEQLPVYNLEVDGEHVYFVGQSGVLVHNSGETYRMRHYTNRVGSRGIEKDGVIRASDQNKVFMEPAKGKPLSAADAETKYLLKQGRGRDFVEFDVPKDLVTRRWNPTAQAWEWVVDGDLALLNPRIIRRK